jgi:hypothetical protein
MSDRNISAQSAVHKSNDTKLPPFVPLLKSTLATPAWRAMSLGARSLYVALKSRHNLGKQNAVYLSIRDAAEELDSNKDHIGRWYRELQHYGFAVLVTPGRIAAKGTKGRAAHWRLTDCWHDGQPPTKDFERWNGIKFRGSVPQSGDASNSRSVPQSGDASNSRSVPQSGDTSVPQSGDTSVPQTGDTSVPQTGDIIRRKPKGLPEEAAHRAAPLGAAGSLKKNGVGKAAQVRTKVEVKADLDRGRQIVAAMNGGKYVPSAEGTSIMPDDKVERAQQEEEEASNPYENYDPNDDREDDRENDREDDRPRVEVTRIWDVKPGVCKAVRPSTQVNNE